MSRPDADKTDPSAQEKAGVEEDNSAPPEPQNDVAVIAKMLTAVGGGAVSQGLALDLVLNDVVEQTRKSTRATGAAIALARDGEMICRATTGNAPDLGVRVETESGISGACLLTGKVQLCSDTELDSRVNAEACRRLHVRSMLIAPISDAKQTFGIVQVFAAEPNAFNEEDVKTLESLALQVAESRQASENSVDSEASANESAEPHLKTPTAQAERATEPIPPPADTEEEKKRDALTSVLVVLVIAAAILLGVVIGVGMTRRRAAATKPAQGDVSSFRTQAPPNASGQGTASAPGADTASSATPVSQPKSTPSAPVEVPNGGLIVTQNGKIIYRSEPSGASKAISGARGISSGNLIHRVNPSYPEAARAQHIQGPVVLNAHVLGNGTVGGVDVVAGDPVLAEAATEAVKQWKYQPYLVNGQPVERLERITVKFSLPSS